jgi:hypothetical protein
MSKLENFNTIMRHVYTEPRFRAKVEWHSEYGIGAQLHRQVPRAEMKAFVAGHGWQNPDREVSLVRYEEPDWDWWEPRHDQLWRRQAARQRELDRKLGERT